MESITCTKTFSEIPFAHRQHRHEGHCADIHGHNWSISVTFACKKRDRVGFVIDFGKLHFLKDWIEEKLDHALLLSEDDPQLTGLKISLAGMSKITPVPDCSCEGLARWIWEVWDPMVRDETRDRVWIESVYVQEDSHNSAGYINFPEEER